ncbi:hypothetical protein BCR44DRAFT_373225 [Catenaria anguillulae PL171]|uniref:Uncharacterized protein n=1 Tax=Catenaria anguillulae PL171 TaxID=765915 RepID=A0A1Y2H4C3_9FUNG|nr:hypothetical protein BCR44DRAFT_373225 [Catenaria anguillulae PL171]
MTYSMIADGVPPSIQLLDRWVPLWGTAGTAVLPIIAVGGSAWSLRLAYDGRRQRQKMRGAAEDDHTSHVVMGAAKTDQWHSAERESSVLATVKDCDGSQVPTSTSATASLSRSLVAGVSPTTLTLSRSPGPINYPLTKTFRILTYGIFTTWVLATILLLFPMVGPIRNIALFNFIMTMTIALESSFEQLLKRHNRRAIPQRRVGGEADRAREEKTTRVGNGNGEMVGESLLDVAGEFLNRTNQ